MRALERAESRARAVARRARRVPNRAYREAQKRTDRARARGPLLSVVMPVYNVREWVAASMESVLDQSLRDLELIIVDDGSTDGSMDVVREYAARDDRVRILTKANAGLGAARNTGMDEATGRYLCFVDSDDLVLPEAYEAMVSQLEASGSDFVTGAFARGDEDEALQPNWVTRTMTDRGVVRLEDDPWFLLDITAWNKVFRRSFWTRHGFRFVEGVRYEDQVPITRAYLTARAFDVVSRRVYLWRTRLDGTSITQQKSSIRDLTDRLASQTDCAALVRDAAPHVRETWYLKLLDYDFPNYLLAAVNADEHYVGMLSAHLQRLREEIPPHVWHQVQFRNRAKSWVVSRNRIDLGSELRAWFETELFGLPVVETGGRLLFETPDSIGPDDLPEDLRRVHEIDVRPVVRLVETRWDDDVLVLRGSAYLFPVPTTYAEHRLSLDLVGPEGERVPVPLTRWADEDLDALARMTYADMGDTGFEARIDGRDLAGRSRPGEVDYRLEFHQEQGDYAVTSDITHVLNHGSGGSRAPRVCADRLVRLVGVVGTGHGIHVHDAFALTSAATVVGDETVELEITSAPGDPVEALVLKGPRGKSEPLELERGLGGVVRTRLTPGPERRLTARHRSGHRSTVLWGTATNVVGASAGGFVHRGRAQNVVVDRLAPAVQVHEVRPDEDGLRVRGTSLGAEGLRLLLVGPRSRSTASDPLPEGAFEVTVPVRQDPWGLGATALAAGVYELAGESGTGQVPPEDRSEAVVAADTALREALPVQVEAPGQRLSVGLTPTWSLRVESMALSKDDAPPRRQGLLRLETYPRARASAPRDAVLFETFAGRTAGDSPAALARELVRRDLGLDLVWGVADASVTVPEGTRAVPRLSREWFELLGSARYLVNNNNFPWFFEKAEHQTYLQTWHGTPLKRIANDVPDKQFLSLTYQRLMLREVAAWDQLVSPSPYCTDILPKAFDYTGPVLESGYPRNDALVGEAAEATRQRVREALGVRPHERVLLYAPTWRETARSGSGHSKVLHLDPARLVAALPDTVVLVRGHANTAQARSATTGTDRRVVDVTLHPEISDLFVASDVLVTDYSSVMFDYAVLGRPQAFLVPDLEQYRDTVRGFYFDFEAEAPGPLLEDEASLVRYLADPAATDERFRERREDFRHRFAPLDDGEAAARVVDAVFGPPTP